MWQVLLDHGAEVNAEDVIGQTPLHKACWSGSDEIVTVSTSDMSVVR